MHAARFDTFELDVRSGELRQGARTVRLQDKPLQLLVLLLEHPGKVVTRGKIRERLWSADTVVEFEHGIGTALKKLRRALNDDAASPRFIETLPRRGYRWLAGVSGVDASLPGPSEHSIAVLPFMNLSEDKENEYFSDGLAEEILNLLTSVKGLRVTARTSAFAFRGSAQDVRKIGEILNVRTILEGSVRRSGNRVRVTAQLIHTGDGYHLWSDRYDREVTDMFAVQDDIARAIVDRLKLRFAGHNPIAVRQTANLDAYDAYLKGRYHAATVTPAAAVRARKHFEDAIALDPSFAPAYSGLAKSLFISVQFGLQAGSELMPQVKTAALKAIALDETDSEAHALLGLVAGAFDYDWTEALRRSALALACEPQTSEVRHFCAQFILIPLRRFDEAIALLEPVLMADPLSPLPRKTMAEALVMSGRDRQRAIDELRRLLEWNDGFWLANFTLGNIYAQSGMRAEAVAEYEEGLRVAAFPPMIGGLASLHAQAGDSAEAERILRGLDVPEQASGRAKGLMFFHLGCSAYDQVADYLERLIDARDPDVIWLGCHPFLRDLQQHPRLGALLSKMNFP